MKYIKIIGLGAIVFIVAAIIGYKTHRPAATSSAKNDTNPRVLLVANMGEADETGDSCAEIIHLVRDAHKRGIAVEEVDSSSSSPLLKRYHVLVIPTVIIFDQNGKVVSRLQGEGGDVIQKLRQDLAQLK